MSNRELSFHFLYFLIQVFCIVAVALIANSESTDRYSRIIFSNANRNAVFTLAKDLCPHLLFPVVVNTFRRSTPIPFV
jgi:hypothetical protein